MSVKRWALNSYTHPLTQEQTNKLRTLLEERGFTFSPKPYTIFFAQKEKLSVAVYEKGPKVLLQGRGIEDFVKFTLEPEIFGEARLGYEEVHSPEMFQPHFGVDESGKGDFFGPLVIAGVFADRQSARQFLDLGVQDSKRMKFGGLRATRRMWLRSARRATMSSTKSLVISTASSAGAMPESSKIYWRGDRIARDRSPISLPMRG